MKTSVWVDLPQGKMVRVYCLPQRRGFSAEKAAVVGGRVFIKGIVSKAPRLYTGTKKDLPRWQNPVSRPSLIRAMVLLGMLPQEWKVTADLEEARLQGLWKANAVRRAARDAGMVLNTKQRKLLSELEKELS
ncbi:MAG: hypothetical protein JKY94_17635 [Rhodobacteraceae bacterium]|nr:hypothetical protein [Paracoccaceae bacterium]